MIKNLSSKSLAYHGLRIVFATSFMLHGAVRLPKWQAFAEGVAKNFDNTIVGGFPALAMGYVIPLGETVAGLLLLIGARFLKIGAGIGFLVMLTLVTGTCLIEKWEWLPSQLLHTLIISILLLWSEQLEQKS